MKSKKTVLCISVFLSLIIAIIVLAHFVGDEPNFLDKSRPSEALIKPEIPDAVSGIRIQAKERDCGDNIPDGYTALQIYYGFNSEGEWQDYPCENYDLFGLNFDVNEFGYTAAGDDHVVKIGDKIIIALSTSRINDVTITDTLNSKIETIDKYFTKTVFTEVSGDFKSGASTIGDGYAYLKENALELGTDEYEFDIEGHFDKWYFVVIDVEDLSEDYMLTFANSDEDSAKYDFTVTYNDIARVLED